MAAWVSRVGRFLKALPLLLVFPLIVLVPALALAVTDLLWALIGRRRTQLETLPSTDAVSVVIPNWNGRDLLEKYVPSVLQALEGNPRNELIVVDNASEDGSAEFLRTRFPQVRVVELPRNLGFGGGSNAGFRAAVNDIVILLNSDMRVEPDFVAPLLEGFADPLVFAVSCQIFFTDPHKVREETGLTQAWWENGGLRVRHREDKAITGLFPCFYGGGGSCAFDRRKMLELGGFDELYAPFYLEDTDLGYMAWKRGWKVLYQPRSVVYHEHRGTIGRKFSQDYISGVLKKNFVLFCWKNVHEPARLLEHLVYANAGALVSLVFGEAFYRATLPGLWRALLELRKALRSRWRARQLAVVDDAEAFLRPLGGYFRDRFAPMPPEPERPSVLFVSPYPVAPPTHGGGVFMNQTIRELARHADVHLVALLDWPHEREAHAELDGVCASMEFLVRMSGTQAAPGSLLPHAVQEFQNRDLEWLLHRQMHDRRIDVLQLEYTNMGQYAPALQRIAVLLFEHDVYFQSISRGLPYVKGALARAKARYEYLRALRYELGLLPRMDRVQVCSRANKDYLLEFAPELEPRLDDHLRAGIQTNQYTFQPTGREPGTLLFMGSFRHDPNLEAVQWFTRYVLPLVLERRPDARLVLVGSDPPAAHALNGPAHAVEMRGFVEDIREPLGRYAVFI